MKTRHTLVGFLGVSAACALLAGCLFKPASVTTRRFVLTPVTAESRGDTTGQRAVGIRRVTLPEYLLKGPMAVRRSENEIEYLENALWAERLDTLFQRTLVADLAAQLPAHRVRLAPWQPGEVAFAVQVRVDRLDVDTQGRGALVARWQIESTESGTVLKSGEASLSNTAAAPHAEPAAVARAISHLIAQLSQTLAVAVGEVAGTSPAP